MRGFLIRMLNGVPGELHRDLLQHFHVVTEQYNAHLRECTDGYERMLSNIKTLETQLRKLALERTLREIQEKNRG